LFNPIDEHTARAALRLAAAEFGAVQLEIVAQNVEQRRIGPDPNGVSRTVNPQCEYGRHGAIVCTLTAMSPIRNTFK
jgi:hypothetical protein